MKNHIIYVCIHLYSGRRRVFPDWLLSKIMTNRIIYVFIYVYRGRRRLFPSEYCRKWWQIILFMFLFIFTAAAGAFFQLSIVEHDDKSSYLGFILLYSGCRRFSAGEYFQILSCLIFLSRVMVWGTDLLRRCHRQSRGLRPLHWKQKLKLC